MTQDQIPAHDALPMEGEIEGGGTGGNKTRKNGLEERRRERSGAVAPHRADVEPVELAYHRRSGKRLHAYTALLRLPDVALQPLQGLARWVASRPVALVDPARFGDAGGAFDDR